MKYLLRYAMVVASFGMMLGTALPALAAHDCWCLKSDGSCEHHNVNAAGATLICGSSGATSCTEFCTSRGWTARFCDVVYFDHTAATGDGSCPETAAVSATPTDTPEAASSTQLYNPLGDITIPDFIARGIRAIVGIIGALALLMMVAGGVMWMTAGDSDRVKTAKSMIVNSTIGLLLIFFSYSIISIFFSILRA